MDLAGHLSRGAEKPGARGEEVAQKTMI